MNQVIEKLFCMLFQILLTAVDKKSQNQHFEPLYFTRERLLLLSQSIESLIISDSVPLKTNIVRLMLIA